MSQEQAAKKKIRVAIIDDDQNFLELTCRRLKQATEAEFEVTCFQEPMDIFDPRFLKGFDVYVVDYRMGQVDGIDLIAGLRGRIHQGPFILCSGVLDPKQRERAARARVEMVLEKSKDADEALGRYILDLVQKRKRNESD